MKAPGIRARKTGKRLQRGKALQVMVYPRARTKSVIVEASRDVSLPLSSFMIMASLKAAASLQGCKVADLIPQTELHQYLREKIVCGKRSKRARCLEQIGSLLATTPDD